MREGKGEKQGEIKDRKSRAVGKIVLEGERKDQEIKKK